MAENLPPGFTLDPQPEPSANQLPEGFTVDEVKAEINRRGLQAPEPTPYQQMAADVGPLQAFLIGAGRGFYDVGRGLGILEPAGESEKAGMQALREQRPYTTGAGEIAGQTAPFLPLGAGMAAGATRLPVAGRIAAAGAMGAKEADVIATGRQESDTLAEAGLGGAAAMGAEIMFPLIGRAGRRLYQNAFGKAPTGAMLDSVGRPTPEFQQALDASGMTFDEMSEQAIQAVQQMAPGTVPEQAVRAARFQTEGIPASLGDITRESAQQTTEQRLMGSTLDPAAEPFRQFRLQQSEAIKDNLRQAVGEDFTKEEAGQMMQAALEGRQSTLRSQKNELYKLAQSKAEDLGGLPLFTDGIRDAVPPPVDFEDLAITAPQAVESAQTILAKYGVMDPPAGMERKINVTPLTLENVERFRKTLNRIERGDTTGAVGVITGPVRNALDAELVEMAESSGAVVSRLGDGPKKVTDLNGNGITRLDDVRGLTDTLKSARATVAQMKQEFSPTELVGKLTRPRKRGEPTPMIEASKVYDAMMGKAQPVEQVRKVVKSLGDAGEAGQRGLGALQTTTMLDLIESGFSTPSRTVDGVPIFNPVAFKRRLNNVGMDKVEAVFKDSPGVIRKIKNIDEIATDLIPTDRATPKGSADTILDALNAFGLLSIMSAKVPGVSAIVTPVTQAASEAAGRVKTGRVVREAIDGTPEVRKAIDAFFPAIKGMLQTAAPPVAMETQRQQEK